MAIIKRPSTSNPRKFTYEVRFRDPSGVHRSKTFKKKEDARAFESSISTKLNKGTYVGTSRSKITLGEVFDLYMQEKRNLKPKTKADVLSIWNYHLKPELGSTQISSITLESVNAWTYKAVTGEKPKTTDARMNKVLGELRRLLDFAVDNHYLTRNPLIKSNGRIAKIALPKVDSSRATNALTLNQLKQLAEHAGEFQDLILLAGICGLRWAELVGLRASDFSKCASKLTISRTITEVSGHFTIQSTKTGKARSLYVPSHLAKLLKKRLDKLDSNDLVFSNSVGKPLSNNNFRNRVYSPAIEASGVPRITIHDLRHTAASLAISNGGHANAVARMLGHADPALTLRRYTHLFDDDLRNLANQIDRNLGQI